jgi:DNA-binding XRE family transcriptional regulator
MAIDSREVFAKLPLEERLAAEKRAAEVMDEYLTLQAVRRERKFTQVMLAKILGVTQKQVSALEKRKDMHVSTLRRTIEAMGGTLAIEARFPDRDPVVLKGISSGES